MRGEQCIVCGDVIEVQNLVTWIPRQGVYPLWRNSRLHFHERCAGELKAQIDDAVAGAGETRTAYLQRLDVLRVPRDIGRKTDPGPSLAATASGRSSGTKVNPLHGEGHDDDPGSPA